jgi:hypothetical protein
VIKGSIGNTTFYDTPVNPICGRTRVKPFNPNSTNQKIARLSFMAAVGNWPLLSSSQRTEYNNLARDLHTAFPSLVHSANGRSLFLRFYSVQELFFRHGITGVSGSTRIDASYVAETPQTIAEITPLGVGGTGFTVTIYNYHTSALGLIFEISYPQPLVRYFFDTPLDWSFCGYSTIDAAAGPGFPGIAFNNFTSLLAMRAYFCRLRLIAPIADSRNWSSIPVVIRGETNTI